MTLVIGIILGCAVGAIGAAALVLARKPAPEPAPAPVADPIGPLAEQVARLADEQRHAHEEALNRLLETNKALLEQERVRSGSELDGKKSLIDQQLVTMTGELDKVTRARAPARRRSAQGLRRAEQRAPAPARRASPRSPSTPNSSARSWPAPRRAVNGANAWPRTCCGSPACSKASTTASSTRSTSAGRPDYTFLLPNGRVMHMDVKFPLDNYVRHLEANNDLERKQFRDQFLRDVRDRVKELTTRGYLDGRRHRRLPADVHPQRAGLRIRPGERPQHPRRRAPQQDRRLLTAHAVRGARSRAPGRRQLPARTHVERDSQPARRVLAAVGEVLRAAREGAAEVREASRRSTPA